MAGQPPRLPSTSGRGGDGSSSGRATSSLSTAAAFAASAAAVTSVAAASGAKAAGRSRSRSGSNGSGGIASVSEEVLAAKAEEMARIVGQVADRVLKHVSDKMPGLEAWTISTLDTIFAPRLVLRSVSVFVCVRDRVSR